MYGRHGRGDVQWDHSNSEALLRWSAAHGVPVGGVEMGNEKEELLDPTDYAGDVLYMRKLLDELWDDPEDRPLLIGPDENPRPDWLLAYLQAGGNVSDVITYHLYPGYGLDPHLKQEILEPGWLDFTRVVAGEIQRVQVEAAPSTALWVGETAAAWHSGEHGIADAYESGFWFIDQLGTLATMGHKVMCRQCFVGGNYTMVGVNDGFVPRPDYWTGLLFKKLMGSIVLGITQTEPAKQSYMQLLRGYAHCTPAPHNYNGSVTFAYLNLDHDTKFKINITGSNPDKTHFSLQGERVEYFLTADLLDSETVMLNHNLLKLEGDTVPDVLGLGKWVSADEGLVVPARSYGFIMWPNAGAQACR
eukprot:TRINITY_DN9229_c0_g1_i1.p1 TRINITY_DN9229_c0_g1~~TRINITY_DN9229_c0_g1_i1.p1  ORF type:complete len:360 (-),score=67.19 TRINITY_DN9229_c0_g1_i1:525-1604(-)